MNEGVVLIAEVERWRIETKYCDLLVEDIDEGKLPIRSAIN